ncbi:hypothetical protein GALMADRAFT_143640 [Galerina marginata CBS 339.88]|uniref:C2H2-type domain-containing protein n=1 Tax=Galerina marginata (strain CBS 339.88) TaxID=685588 RepID=A0A067SPB3_GALM3|nr:hypothetical protein GALMADRAFT_143640 [Galerina marginata CBS 339.88]
MDPLDIDLLNLPYLTRFDDAAAFQERLFEGGQDAQFAQSEDVASSNIISCLPSPPLEAAASSTSAPAPRSVFQSSVPHPSTAAQFRYGPAHVAHQNPPNIFYSDYQAPGPSQQQRYYGAGRSQHGHPTSLLGPVPQLPTPTPSPVFSYDYAGMAGPSGAGIPQPRMTGHSYQPPHPPMGPTMLGAMPTSMPIPNSTYGYAYLAGPSGANIHRTHGAGRSYRLPHPPTMLGAMPQGPPMSMPIPNSTDGYAGMVEPPRMTDYPYGRTLPPTNMPFTMANQDISYFAPDRNYPETRMYPQVVVNHFPIEMRNSTSSSYQGGKVGSAPRKAKRQHPYNVPSVPQFQAMNPSSSSAATTAATSAARESPTIACGIVDKGLICGQLIKGRHDFLRHVASPHGITTSKNRTEATHLCQWVNCQLAAKLFTSSAYAAHLLTHTKVVFKCTSCGKRYSREDVIKNHLKSHDDSDASCIEVRK